MNVFQYYFSVCLKPTNLPSNGADKTILNEKKKNRTHNNDIVCNQS